MNEAEIVISSAFLSSGLTIQPLQLSLAAIRAKQSQTWLSNAVSCNRAKSATLNCLAIYQKTRLFSKTHLPALNGVLSQSQCSTSALIGSGLSLKNLPTFFWFRGAWEVTDLAPKILFHFEYPFYFEYPIHFTVIKI